MTGRGKGRFRGRGRGRGRGQGVADTTPSVPPTSTPIRPPELGQQYTFTPAQHGSPPRRALTQTQIDVRQFPPPQNLFNTSTTRDQRASSESQQSNPQPHQSRPQPQNRRSSHHTGELSPGETSQHPNSDNPRPSRPTAMYPGETSLNPRPLKTPRQTTSTPQLDMRPPLTFTTPTRHNSGASEAQQSNEVVEEHVDGVDDSVHHESTLPGDTLDYLHQLLAVPNRSMWTCNLSPEKPQPPNTTW